MGQIINNKVNYLNKQAKKGLEISEATTYSRFLENAPVLVTYFRQNKVETTTDSGFGVVETNIGLSGKKFNKVSMVPIYGIDPGSFNLDNDEMGIRGSYQTDGIMIPDVLEPIAEDYFTFEYHDNTFLFKVTNVEMDRIKSNNYFKITFKYDRVMLDELNKQVVDDYTCVFENIGTDAKTILKNSDIDKLESLKIIYNDVKEAYLEMFHNSMSSSLVLEENGLFFYDPYLTEFVKRTKLFYEDANFHSLSFDHVLDVPKDFRNRYNRSIFYGIESGTFVFENRMRYLRIHDIMTYFYRSGLPYYTEHLMTANEAEGLYIYKHTEEFDYFYKGDNPVFNTILLYKMDDEKLEEHVLNNLKHFVCDSTRDYFVCIPIVLFIIKNIINNITINKIN